MKILIFMINAIYWLGLFIVPAGILLIAGMWFYFDNNNNLFFPIAFGVAGIISGVILAEYVRKHYGLNSFWSRLSYTPDIDNNEDEKSVDK